MRIKLQINQIAELMKALRQGGEDPNDYFEVVLGNKPPLEEGQTRLTEFNNTITDKQEPRKERKTKAKKTKAKRTKAKKGTKASKSKTTAKPKRGRAKLVERLESLPDGERTFEAIVAKCPHPEHEVDFKKAAHLLHDVSSNKTTWLTPKTKEPSGTAVRSVYNWLKRNKKPVIPKETKLAPSSEAWIEAEVQWLGQHYEHKRQQKLDNKMIAIQLAQDVPGTKQRKKWEIRDMAKNLGLN